MVAQIRQCEVSYSLPTPRAESGCGVYVRIYFSQSGEGRLPKERTLRRVKQEASSDPVLLSHPPKNGSASAKAWQCEWREGGKQRGRKRSRSAEARAHGTTDPVRTPVKCEGKPLGSATY